MLRGHGWQIGRVLGIPIVVHVSWLVVFAFVTWTLATAYLPTALPGQSQARYWGMGGMAALLLFCSVLLHELGHCWVALRYRIPIGQITLFVFGGVAHMRREAPSPRAEFLIAMAGPVVSLVIGGLCLGAVYWGESWSGRWQGHGLLVLGGLLGTVNVQIGVFNLIPGFPLDGGRALRAGLWAWSHDFYGATRRSAAAGLAVGVVLACAGAAVLLGAVVHLIDESLLTNGMWLAMIGLFLFATARASRQHAAFGAVLTQVLVSEVMSRAVVAIPAEMTVEAAVKQYLLPHGESGFPVIEGARLVGLATVADVQRIPQSVWARRTAREVMRPMVEEFTVTAAGTALQALERMALVGTDRLFVVDGDRLVGVVTRTSIGRYLRFRAPSGL